MNKTSEINSFLILKEMSDQQKDIRFASIKNIIAVHIVKGSGQVTIGVDGKTAMDLLAGKQFVGGLLLADKKQFDEIEQGMSK
jgi:hypothetical protein